MNDSQEFRHACETRWLAKLSPEERTKYCALVQKYRGREAAVALYRAAEALLADPATTPSADG